MIVRADIKRVSHTSIFHWLVHKTIDASLCYGALAVVVGRTVDPESDTSSQCTIGMAEGLVSIIGLALHSFSSCHAIIGSLTTIDASFNLHDSDTSRLLVESLQHCYPRVGKVAVASKVLAQ